MRVGDVNIVRIRATFIAATTTATTALSTSTAGTLARSATSLALDRDHHVDRWFPWRLHTGVCCPIAGG
jgi:hypothetical protein